VTKFAPNIYLLVQERQIISIFTNHTEMKFFEIQLRQNWGTVLFCSILCNRRTREV